MKSNRLIFLAAIFLGTYALALTISPATRLRSWEAELRWDHWLAYLAWLVTILGVHRLLNRRLPDCDPYLLAIAALLSGWGILSIWRLTPEFGLRQALWLVTSLVAFSLVIGSPANLLILKKYKYVWLTSGLLLTGLTLIFGTNPGAAVQGNGPRLWLGCCGIYFQPSEPLKLLLIVYLAAYFADRVPYLSITRSKQFHKALLPLLAPTILMTGMALLLLLVQRDLGTASIFLFLYAVLVYLATQERRLLLLGGAVAVIAGFIGFALFDVVRLRIEAWLNPWVDPSGRSYQIIQSLLAVANGGIWGRGPGLGNPGLVPVAHSDFIFTAIAEEQGLVGSLGLLMLLMLLVNRGVKIAIQSNNEYQRYLATGLTAYLVGQSILIIGGNLRLLPLTGVTLPFVSYGGSSLLTSFICLGLMAQISASEMSTSQPRVFPKMVNPYRSYLDIGGVLLLGLIGIALAIGWWAVYRGPALLTRTDNARRSIADRYVRRGSLLDRNEKPLSQTEGESGDYTRRYLYPPLSSTIGYTHPIYGQAGLEANLDPYLRGLRGNPDLLIWWHHLLYGHPPPGLDIRLTLDLNLQIVIDQSFGEAQGAFILINPASGEILALGSRPDFDANQLDQIWLDLMEEDSAPLLNRAVLGTYPTGPALGALLFAANHDAGLLENLPDLLNIVSSDCALTPTKPGLPGQVESGCATTIRSLGDSLGSDRLLRLLRDLGLDSVPLFGLPAGTVNEAEPRPTLPEILPDPGAAAVGGPLPDGRSLQVSPLQMAFAAAALSAGGTRPAPWIIQAVNTPGSGWVILPSTINPVRLFSLAAVQRVTQDMADPGLPIWQVTAIAPIGTIGASGVDASDESQANVIWYLGGTLPDWQGTPLILALALENYDPGLGKELGRNIFSAILTP